MHLQTAPMCRCAAYGSISDSPIPIAMRRCPHVETVDRPKQSVRNNWWEVSFWTIHRFNMRAPTTNN